MLHLLALLVAPTWTIVCGGDVMLNSVPVKAKPFEGIAALVRSADVGYANLEIPLTDKNTRTPRKTPEQVARKTQYILRADPGHIENMRSAGFDVVSLGNNHTMDFQKDGLLQMLELLDKAGIAYAGGGRNLAAARKPAVLQVKGQRVGMISFMSFVDKSSNWATWPATASAPGIAVLDFGGKMDDAKRAEVARIVAEARKHCDFLFVAMHWGVEKQTVPTQYQVDLGRAFIDAGAHLVVGAHPHRLQGGELYKNRPILYSMGNLISPLPGETGLAKLTFDGTNFVRCEFSPMRIAGGKVGPYPAAQQSGAMAKFIKLCEQMRTKYPNRQSRPLLGP